MSTINDLLNHEPAPSDPTTTTSSASNTTANTSTNASISSISTSFDPADALTALATLGSGQQYAAPPAPSSTLDHNHQLSDARLPSPQPVIKHEPAGTPRESTPSTAAAQPATADTLDAETRIALEVAKQADLGLRKKRNASESLALPTDTKLPPVPSKKRPAPSSSLPAPKKKGTAKAVKSSKKRKIDPEDDAAPRSHTPSSRPPKSATNRHPRKGSQAGTPGLESSPAPDGASQLAPSDDDAADSSEDHNLYCLCKKPDNHKWMIGCDGGCDDWFHGDCVNMKQADEGLVDRFICPHCEEVGRGHTTWKPVCRRAACRRPARLAKERQSKYCSEDCGALFMAEQLQRTAGAKPVNGLATKDKANKAKKSPVNGASSQEGEEPTPLGGVLRSKDLKALVDASPNIQTFRNLGTGVLSPPHTASPTCATFASDLGLALTSGETERLTALHKEKSQLQDRLEVLKDREKFVSMAKEQALRVAEREKIKMKEFCGYDSRLSWSDAEFLLWRNGVRGRASFECSTLSPTPEQMAAIAATATNGGDTMVLDSSNTDPTRTPAESVCLKKRCPKHPQWQKLNLQDARFEELEVVEAIRECEKEEKSVRERARRRGAKDGLAKELMVGEGGGEGGGGGAGVERNREGWVEVVAN